jgi:hypothetical protein
VILIAAGGIHAVLSAWRPSPGNIAAFRAVMALFIVSGCVGVVQHFLGNIDYARDSNPSLAGLELYKEALVGATPALAPGTMVQLGLVGLLFAYRHPAAKGGPTAPEEQNS